MSTADDIARAAGVTPDELRASLANAGDHAKSTGMTDEEFVLWIWHAGFITARDHLAEQEPTVSVLTVATRALQHHRVDWFPPEPPASRVPTLLCLGCGWRQELDGYGDESDAGLEHRVEAALRAAARIRKEQG